MNRITKTGTVAAAVTRLVGASATACIALALLTPTAQAQQRVWYGNDGRVQGRTTTDSAGNVTAYGKDGRVTGRASTDSQGTVTIYGADGRRIGTSTTSKNK